MLSIYFGKGTLYEIFNNIPSSYNNIDMIILYTQFILIQGIRFKNKNHRGKKLACLIEFNIIGMRVVIVISQSLFPKCKGKKIMQKHFQILI